MDNMIPVKYIDCININEIDLTELGKLETCEYRILSSYLIGKIPAKKLLDSDELDTFNEEIEKSISVKTIKAKKLVVVLKATRLCNLRVVPTATRGQKAPIRRYHFIP